MVAKKKDWVPARQDVIWIDCNPPAGSDMRDLHPFLVLSPQNFNAKTSLVIGLPLTTAEYNADNPFAVAAGKAKGKTGKTSYVLCHQPESFNWRVHHAKPHPLRKLDKEHFAEACALLEQIIRLPDYHESSAGIRSCVMPPCMAVPFGRRALSATERRQTFAQRLASHRGVP